MAVEQIYRWSDEENQLSIYCRESGDVIYQSYFDGFHNAKKCADAFIALYNQGQRHGKRLATEEMQRTLDHIDRSI